MKTLQVLLAFCSLALYATGFNVRPEIYYEPRPYEFSYGVSVPETGDAKEHRERANNGRTEGEYRWLQPNGLYRVVSYFVEGDSGFQADVREEPGPDILNYYANNYGGLNLGSVHVASALGVNTGLAEHRQPGLVPLGTLPPNSIYTDRQSAILQQHKQQSSAYNSAQHQSSASTALSGVGAQNYGSLGSQVAHQSYNSQNQQSHSRESSSQQTAAAGAYSSQSGVLGAHGRLGVSSSVASQNYNSEREKSSSQQSAAYSSNQSGAIGAYGGLGAVSSVARQNYASQNENSLNRESSSQAYSTAQRGSLAGGLGNYGSYQSSLAKSQNQNRKQQSSSSSSSLNQYGVVNSGRYVRDNKDSEDDENNKS